MNFRPIMLFLIAALMLLGVSASALAAENVEASAKADEDPRHKQLLPKPRINEVDRIPLLNAEGKEAYKKWTYRGYNRAFAINPRDGSWGLSPDEDDMTKISVSGGMASEFARNMRLTFRIQDALNRCSKQPGDTCFVYAQNGDVVWDGSIPQSTSVAQSPVIPEAAKEERRQIDALAKADEDRLHKQSLPRPRINEVDRIPLLNAEGKEAYKKWTYATYNRAFAINPRDGSWGVSPDENDLARRKQASAVLRGYALRYAIEDALERCKKQPGDTCFVYAQNGDVVWDGSIPQSTSVAQSPVIPEAAKEERRQIDALAKADEDRRQKEALAKAEDERRQKELQAKAEDERRQKDALAKAEEDRRQKEVLAKAEDDRRQKQLQAKAEDERRHRESVAKADEDRRQKDALARAEEDRRQKEALAKAGDERNQQVALAQAENLRLAAELSKLREQLSNQGGVQPVANNRKALIIGNDSYRSVTPLVNARADARLISENLSMFGYAVTLKMDLTEKQMKEALRVFKGQVNPGDEVAIFYAGHGVQFGSANYLLPVDVAGDNEEQVRDEAIPLQRILDDMTDKKAKFTLAMIDACRDNPFKSSGRSVGGTRGLAVTSAATGQMVIFSAGTGQQALDKLGPADKVKNGVFTRVFVEQMKVAGVPIANVMRNVRNEVARLAKTIGHDQVPAIYDQVLGDFYFSN